MARVWKFVGAGTWDGRFVVIPAVSVYAEGSLISISFFSRNITFSLILVVFLRPRIRHQMLKYRSIGSFGAAEIAGELGQVFLISLLFLILR